MIANTTHQPKRPGWRLILGPPGTGKTTAALTHLEREALQFRPEQIAFVAFTRAAREVAKKRAAKVLRVPEDNLVWFRTIHSTAYRLLNLKKEDVLDDKDMVEFAKRHGYDFSSQGIRPDDDMDFTIATDDDELLATLSWGRSRMLTPEQTLIASPFALEPQRYYRFVDRYNKFRSELKKLDFHDMLERCVGDENLYPNVKVAFVDEAQDLSPLQYTLVEQWFKSCERVYVAGDDDQAIYGWQGGDPDWLIGLSEICGSVDILRKSYRIPAIVHAIATRIIAQNEDRIEKVYVPREDNGEVYIMHRVEAAIHLSKTTDKTYVLARNWYVLHQFSKVLHDRGVVFAAERHPNWSPLGRPKVISAVRTAQQIQKNHSVSPKSIADLLDFIPSGKKGGGILPRGVKKMVADMKGYANRVNLKSMGLGKLVEIIDLHGPTAVLIRKVDQSLREALDAILKKHGEIPAPKVILRSMHSSKGDEAHTVVILPEMSRKSHEAYMSSGAEREAENRIAYVAVTRAKHRLIICRPEEDSHRYYNYIAHARKALEQPTVDIAHARELLATSQRFLPEEEIYVLKTWYNVHKKSVYSFLLEIPAKFERYGKALLSSGFERVDARWGAYLMCQEEELSRSREARSISTAAYGAARAQL